MTPAGRDGAGPATVVCALCGEPERHYARALSRRCYVKAREAGALWAFPARHPSRGWHGPRPRGARR